MTCIKILISARSKLIRKYDNMYFYQIMNYIEISNRSKLHHHWKPGITGWLFHPNIRLLWSAHTQRHNWEPKLGYRVSHRCLTSRPLCGDLMLYMSNSNYPRYCKVIFHCLQRTVSRIQHGLALLITGSC